MKWKMKLTGLALAGVLAGLATASAIAHSPGAQGANQGQMPMMGQGMMGQGYQGQMPMMRHGMMGQMPMMGGYGHGQMEPLRRDLTADEVKHMMEHRVAWAGNPNLKVGEVTEKDDDTIEVEIVTKNGSLVQKIEIDRHTGRMQTLQ